MIRHRGQRVLRTHSENTETELFEKTTGSHEAVSPVCRNTECAVDNSNDNHGVAVTNMIEIHDTDKYGTNGITTKYNEIGYNLLPTDSSSKSIHQFDTDLDSTEILISFDVKTGDLNVDVVSQETLEYFDHAEHTVLASTFDQSVMYRHQDIFTKVASCPSEGAEVIQTSHIENDNLHNSGEHIVQVSYRESSQVQYDEIESVITPHFTGSPGGGDYNVHKGHSYTDKPYPIPDKEPTRSDGTTDTGVRVETSDHEHRRDQYNGRRKHDRYYKKHWPVDHYGYCNDRHNDRRYSQEHCRQINNYMEDKRETTKPRHVLSFSESDLIYSSKNEKQNKNYKTPRIQAKKQITILKRGDTLQTDTEDVQSEEQHKFTDDTDEPSYDVHKPFLVDGENVTYGRHSVNISSDKKYYSTKHGEMGEDADGSGDTEEEQSGKRRKNTKHSKGSKQKTRKPKKKVPKTRMEVFQSQLKGGQMKSIFSRWKSDGLKRIKLVEELHTGTFAMKYKAIYNNEMVVLSVYIDQDTSDINAIDMVHLRNSKFINGIRDCFTGPYSSLWLLSRYFHYSDLQKILSKDPDRHVIGEVHAQFVTAGLVLGLDYLHQNNIVHGNIKPSKILISRNGFPVLTGYLIVNEAVLEERRDVYTPAYAAPERFRGHRGRAIDIFSVGCVGYEIVTGRTPFDDGNLEELRANILDHSYRPVFEPELFSYAGEMFIDNCLRKPLKYRFTIGHDRENVMREEWFSTLDLYQMERQNVYSPLLQAMKQIENSTTLPWRQKTVEFDWGRALDITRPNLEPVRKFDLKFTKHMIRDFY